MSASLAKSSRDAMKAKAHARANQKASKVDASNYGAPEPFMADKPTGQQPNRRAFKDGGKVVNEAEEKSEPRADRTPRKGKAFGGPMVDPGMAEATTRAGVPQNTMNFARARSKLAGAAGLKTGGKVEDEAKEKTDTKAEEKDEKRVARKSGGRAKGAKTNVNVIIAQHPHGGPPMAAGQPPAAPPAGIPIPMPMPPGGAGAPPPMAMPGGPGGPPIPPPSMMGRKRGGRVHMTAGAGSGEGRLEKIEIMKKH